MINHDGGIRNDTGIKHSVDWGVNNSHNYNSQENMVDKMEKMRAKNEARNSIAKILDELIIKIKNDEDIKSYQPKDQDVTNINYYYNQYFGKAGGVAFFGGIAASIVALINANIGLIFSLFILLFFLIMSKDVYWFLQTINKQKVKKTY